MSCSFSVPLRKERPSGVRSKIDGGKLRAPEGVEASGPHRVLQTFFSVKEKRYVKTDILHLFSAANIHFIFQYSKYRQKTGWGDRAARVRWTLGVGAVPRQWRVRIADQDETPTPNRASHGLRGRGEEEDDGCPRWRVLLLSILATSTMYSLPYLYYNYASLLFVDITIRDMGT